MKKSKWENTRSNFKSKNNLIIVILFIYKELQVIYLSTTGHYCSNIIFNISVIKSSMLEIRLIKRLDK